MTTSTTTRGDLLLASVEAHIRFMLDLEQHSDSREAHGARDALHGILAYINGATGGQHGDPPRTAEQILAEDARAAVLSEVAGGIRCAICEQLLDGSEPTTPLGDRGEYVHDTCAEPEIQP